MQPALQCDWAIDTLGKGASSPQSWEEANLWKVQNKVWPHEANLWAPKLLFFLPAVPGSLIRDT